MTPPKLLTMFLSIGLTLLFLELGIRAYEQIAQKIPMGLNLADRKDKILGWQGKKVFGPIETDKFKLMIIGDSFTDGVLVDEDNMYYSYLKKDLPVELFVYGGAGYGTLQEYLVLDEYIDVVRPDLIMLQLASNDLINNSFSLERKSYLNSNNLPRPYLINDQIEVLTPASLGGVRLSLTQNSRLALRLFEKSDKILSSLASKSVVASVEEVIALKEGNVQEYQEAVQSTSKLMDLMKRRAQSTPVVVVPTDVSEPYFSTFRSIAEEREMIWIDEPAFGIVKRMEKKEGVTQEDGSHWNELGHKYFGQALLGSMVQRQLIPADYPE